MPIQDVRVAIVISAHPKRTAFPAKQNPLLIAKMMGHRDSEMIIKVYGKFIDEAEGVLVGDIDEVN